MSMKGISPMIATVLLIGFTVAIGAILSLWFSSLTKTQTGAAGAQSETIIKCSNANFQILTADSSNKQVVITHYGSGLTIYPISVLFSDGTLNTTFGKTDPALSATETSTLTIANWPSAATSVKVTATCEYGTVNVTIEDSCTNTEDCWV